MYFRISNVSFLQSVQTIDRDAGAFFDLDGVISIWIKTFYKTNPYIANYYEVYTLFCVI